jgi:hypothetical protein
MDSEDVDVCDDFGFGFAMEEEEVHTSNIVVPVNTRVPVNESHLEIPIEIGSLDASKCLFCQTPKDERESVLGNAGLQSFKLHCVATGRTDLINYLTVNPYVTHLLHRSCNRAIAYSARKGVSDTPLSNVSKSTRRSLGNFDFRNMCFFCGTSCFGCKDFRRVLYGTDFDKKIKQIIHDRGFDTWGLDVQGRIESVADLFAADAVYHLSCYARFSKKLPRTPLKRKRGRPQSDSAILAFQKLCLKLEQECENEIFTLGDLHAMMLELRDKDDGVEDVYCKKYLKELLIQRYGAHIYFASRPGRQDVVGFSKFCDFLLQDKLLSDRSEGEGSKSEKLIKKAATLIKAEIRETCYTREYYPTAQNIQDDGSKVLPSLLNLFLTEIIKSNIKQASIGQCIVQAARPESCLMPLLLGVGIELDSCGVQDVHIKLSRLGFCLTVEEVTRYKHSIMQGLTDLADKVTKRNAVPKTSGSLSEHIDSPVIHFVADNVDHNVRTLDGLNSFHGMGIISTTLCRTGSFNMNSQAVKRLHKPMSAAKATKNKCVPILSFTKDNLAGVAKGTKLIVTSDQYIKNTRSK